MNKLHKDYVQLDIVLCHALTTITSDIVVIVPVFVSEATRINEVLAQTKFLRTLTKTIYISVIFSTLNSILSVANLSRLECAETSFARKSRLYEYDISSIKSTTETCRKRYSFRKCEMRE